MTRTSKALKRLGVAALAVATIGAGVPALVATGASATNANNGAVSITPTTEAGEVATCNPYTVTVSPADTTTVDIQISQTASTGTATIGFCDPGAGSGTNPQPAQGEVTNQVVVGQPTRTASNTCPNPNNNATTTCVAEYTTTTGTFTFGVTSNTVGTMNIVAFVEPSNTAAPNTANETGNNTPDGAEKSATATKYFVTNAENAVTSLECEPVNSSQEVGDTARYSCTAFSTQGNNTRVPVRGVTVTQIISDGASRGAVAGCGQQQGTTPTQSGLTTTTVYGTETNNQGVVFCEVTSDGDAGSITVYNYVERNALGGPQSEEPNDTVTATFFGQGRFIDCNPENPTVRYGIDQVITCVVTDVNGNPVAGELVDFQASFPGGRFTDNAFNSTTKTTDAQGVVTATINNPDQNSTQSQTVTATLRDASAVDVNGNPTTAECERAVGTTGETGQTTTATSPAAGVCSDTVTISYTNAGNPQSPPATGTASTPPATPPGCTTAQANLPVRFNAPSAKINRNGATGPVVNATALVTVTVTGATPNRTVELEAYQQNHFGTANFANAGNTRTALADANGVATFQVRFSSNARARAKMQGCAFGANAGFNQGNFGATGNVLYVRTVLTFTVTRVGVRTIQIQGDSIPARPGGLIVNIHCTDARCKSASNPNGILFQPRANQTTGEFGPVRYTFAPSFQNNRVTLYAATGVQETGEGDAQNVAGRSNNRVVLLF